MSNKAHRAQQKVIDEQLERIVAWYAATSGGKFPEQIAEDKKTYRGKVLRWLEPLLPGENPVLIEEALGDSWTLRLDVIQPKIVA